MRIAVGIDVGGTSTKGALVSEEGEVLERLEMPTEIKAATKSVIAVAERLVTLAEGSGQGVAAVGIGAAGFIDHAEGCVTFSPNLVYDDPQLRTALQSRLQLPVTVDNDANAAAWGERAFGAAHGSDHVAMLTLGTGIGSGFIVEGRLLRGFTGAGAEFGHVVVDPTGPPCPCGLRGCLEQLASGAAIGRMGREAAEADPASEMIRLAGSVVAIEGEHVAAAAARLDDAATRILSRAGRALAVGLSNLVNIFDPEVIVLGGSAVEAGEPFLGPARDELVRMTAAQRRRPARVDRSRLGNDAGILGAAALALDDLNDGGDR
ncbi:MAG TPA: ROK family protein [Actinomycetota bacterium]|nr:ROK family protein [Actinomycetota bacterium]